MSATIHRSSTDSYMKLIAEFPLRRLKTAAEHAKAKRIILRLSPHETDRGTSQYLDVLVDLIADFERRSENAVDSSRVSASDQPHRRAAAQSLGNAEWETGLEQSRYSRPFRPSEHPG
jgi:hypothetical protein